MGTKAYALAYGVAACKIQDGMRWAHQGGADSSMHEENVVTMDRRPGLWITQTDSTPSWTETVEYDFLIWHLGGTHDPLVFLAVLLRSPTAAILEKIMTARRGSGG